MIPTKEEREEWRRDLEANGMTASENYALRLLDALDEMEKENEELKSMLSSNDFEAYKVICKNRGKNE